MITYTVKYRDIMLLIEADDQEEARDIFLRLNESASGGELNVTVADSRDRYYYEGGGGIIIKKE